MSSHRQRLLASTLFAGAAALAAAAAGQAYAQAPTEAVPTAGGTANAPQPDFGPPSSGTQTINSQGQQTNSVQEVVVTGSRIPQPNLSSTSPITTVSAAELKLEGATDAIDILNQLPQTNGNFNNSPNPLSSESGITTVNLRGLGAARTLVLQDGKRLQPGDPTVGGAVDIDQVPSQLIDRVEVVTGGASAAYGSDAIAGVVNFILKHDFQGVQLDVQGGGDQHDNHNNLLEGLESSAGFTSPRGSVVDGQNFVASAIIGANTPDGKGNVEGYISYRKLDPVTEGSRDYSGCLLKQSGHNVPVCSGSENSNLFEDEIGGGDYSVLGHNFVPFGTAGTTPGQLFNSSPYEYLQREDERYQAGFLAHYQVNSKIDVYNDFSFMDDRSYSLIAPSGAFFGSTVTQGNALGALSVNCGNPYLSAQQETLICTNNGIGQNAPGGSSTDLASLDIGRRNIEGGARSTSTEHESFRDVIGARGDLDDAWHYDAYAQYGRTQFTEVLGGYLSNSRISNALNVVNTATGPACASALAVSQGCVPYDIFQDGGVTPAALNYLTESGQEQGYTEEQVADVNITGQLGKYGIKSPFSDRGVGVNLGAEYRRESLSVSPDETLQGNDLAGGSGGALPLSGSFDVYELFGEIVVPIASDQPFIKDLSFDGGYRFSDYSTVGTTESYKLSGEYAPTRDIRFRGSFQRALRAPNVNELFTQQLPTQSSDLTVDPCAAVNSVGNVATASLAQCLNTHVTAAQYGNGIARGTTVNGVAGTNTIDQCPAAQCGALIGGNSKLGPETSDTVSFGGIFTPRWLPGFSFSIDYYHIEVKNIVGTVPGSDSLTQCLDTGAANFCNLIQRSPTGLLFGDATLATAGYANEGDVNTGYLKTSGIDFEGSYRLRLSDLYKSFGNIGALTFNYNGTYTQHFISEPIPGFGSYDCAGYYGATCGAYNPRYSSKLRVSYQSPFNWLVSLQWRYDGAQKYEGENSNPLLAAATDEFDSKRSATNYIDLTGNWKVTDFITLRAGVNNVFDQDPPILSSTVVSAGAPNTSPQYDLLGRTFFMGLTANF
ncbi:MAG: TonB-dependent receptor plug domain-containing protein [Caulobacteraceae bacterium]